MKVVIFGSRSIVPSPDPGRAGEEKAVGVLAGIVVLLGLDGRVSLVVSGGARGVDRIGERWARERSIPVRQFKADWAAGRSAGYRRNLEMAAVADAGIGLWDGVSNGTAHMARALVLAGKPVYLFLYRSHSWQAEVWDPDGLFRTIPCGSTRTVGTTNSTFPNRDSYQYNSVRTGS